MKERSYILENVIFVKILITHRFINTFQFKQWGIFQCGISFHRATQRVVLLLKQLVMLGVAIFILPAIHSSRISSLPVSLDHPPQKAHTGKARLALDRSCTWLRMFENTFSVFLFIGKRRTRVCVHSLWQLRVNIPKMFFVLYFLVRSYWGIWLP